MTPENILELAKQGNVEAIASLLNLSLQSKGITVEAMLQDDCLHLWLKSSQVLDRQPLVTFLLKEMKNLGAKQIKKVKVYGQRISEVYPDWIEEFKLGEIQPFNLEVNKPEKPDISHLENQKKQSNIKQLANQGNVAAITTILNQSIQQDNITVKVSLKNNCLQIILESVQVPDKTISVPTIYRELLGLKLEFVKNVLVYGRKSGEEFPDWFQEFEFSHQSNITQVSTVKQQSQSSVFLATLRKFKFSSVVPYKDALSSELYNSNTVRLLLYFGLFPLVVRFIAMTGGLEQISWILGIYYCSIWGVVLYNLLKPAQFSWVNTLKCVLFTSFVGIPLLLVVQTVPPFSILYTVAHDEGLIPRIIGFVLGVGVLEESCKAMPVYLFLLRPGKLKDPLTAAFYGSVSGLGFAIAEGVNYSFRYAVDLVEGQSNFGSYILSNTIRFVSLPLNHAIWAGIVGYFLGLAAINPSRQGPIIFIGIAICAVLHGLYDTFSGGLIGLAIVAFSILLFVAYLRRSKQMVDEMQKSEADYIASLSEP